MNQAYLAVLAGLLTIASPCVLPVLPALLATSIGKQGRSRPAFIALGFILAFSASAIAFGLFATILGVSPEALRDTAIALLFIFGLLMVWKRPFDLLMLRVGGLINYAHHIGNRAGGGNAGGLLLGMTLGVVWTPCAGPVLGSILTLVASANETGRATGLLLCYALGAGIPMLAIAYGGQAVSARVRHVARYANRIQQFFGLIVIATAIALYFQYDTLLTVWVADFFSR